MSACRTVDGAVAAARSPIRPYIRRVSQEDVRPMSFAASGSVKRYLLNPHKDIDGLLLNDGTQIHFPPQLGDRYASVLKVGVAVHAKGYGSESPNGRAIAVASIVSVLMIRERDIDHALARAARRDAMEAEAGGSVMALLTQRNLLVFAGAVTLFHFANAAMLPLAGQLLARRDAGEAALYMSACIIAAQMTMIPVAVSAGHYAERWGRRPVFLLGFAVLPIRGCLYVVDDHPVFVVAVQLLDGIGAGIFGVLWVTVAADLTRGTGRYNLTLGAIATAQSIGAALSNAAAGYVAQAWGYHTAFLLLAGIAGAAFLLFYSYMPETKDAAAIPGRSESPAAGYPATAIRSVRACIVPMGKIP